jgi:hypothetical protein
LVAARNSRLPPYRTPDNPLMGVDHAGHEYDVDPKKPEDDGATG